MADQHVFTDFNYSKFSRFWVEMLLRCSRTLFHNSKAFLFFPLKTGQVTDSVFFGSCLPVKENVDELKTKGVQVPIFQISLESPPCYGASWSLNPFL